MIIRQANINDFEAFFEMKNDPVNVAWSGHTSGPVYNNLKEWFLRQLSNEKRTIYIALKDDCTYVGYCYLDIIEEKKYDIGYGILSQYKGKGYGTQMISLIKDIVKKKKGSIIQAWISKRNYGSRRIVEKNGFVETALTEIRVLPLLQNSNEFSLWEIKV